MIYFSSPEFATLQKDTRFSAKLAECGRPKRFAVTNKNFIPITNILLPSDYPAAVGVDDAACACR
jgi:hypothetical protein